MTLLSTTKALSDPKTHWEPSTSKPPNVMTYVDVGILVDVDASTSGI